MNGKREKSGENCATMLNSSQSKTTYPNTKKETEREPTFDFSERSDFIILSRARRERSLLTARGLSNLQTLFL